jgi:phosphate uptake regulator
MSKRSTKVIDATKIKSRGLLYRQLVGAYIAGHSAILIKSEQPLSSIVKTTVANFVQASIGFETVEADDTHMLILDVMEHDMTDLKRRVERIRLLIREMLLDIYKASSTGNLDDIKDMKTRDTEIDRIYWLTYRQCNICQKDISMSHRTGLPVHELTACLCLCEVLETMSDHVCKVAEYLLMMGDREGEFETNEESNEVGQKVVNLLTESVKSWVDRDTVLAEKCIREANEMIRGICKISRSNIASNFAPAYAKGVMMIGTKIMLEFCRSIAECTFNASMD